MISKTLAKLLKRLNEQGSIPASDLSDTHRSALGSLFDTAVLMDLPKGRGCIISINNKKAFAAYIDKNCPQGLSNINTANMSRHEGIAQLRNSKHGRLVSEAVILSAKPGCIMQRQSAKLDIGQLTELAQTASFLLGENAADYWCFSGRIALVENYACFVNWQSMEIEADMAIWTAGRISQRMIKWFASEALKNCSFVHCGDYDPVGLNEFLRLKKHLCTSRVTLYIPEKIEMLFKRYCNQNLLRNTNAAGLLKHLRTSDDPDVMGIVELINKNNGALEQEILLLDKDLKKCHF